MGAAAITWLPRATRTRRPDCSISISLRPVSSSSAESSRIISLSTADLDWGSEFCSDFSLGLEATVQLFFLAPVMAARPAIASA